MTCLRPFACALKLLACVQLRLNGGRKKKCNLFPKPPVLLYCPLLVIFRRVGQSCPLFPSEMAFADERCTSSGIRSSCRVLIIGSTHRHTTGLPCQRDPGAAAQITGCNHYLLKRCAKSTQNNGIIFYSLISALADLFLFALASPLL